MRRSTIIFSLIVILMMILFASCETADNQVVSEDSTAEQPQNSPLTTTALETLSEYDDAQSDANKTGEIANKKNFLSIEEAYYHKYRELAETYGTHTLFDFYNVKRGYSGRSYLSGVCIVILMDFNGDGIQDLFVVYANGKMNRVVYDSVNLEIYDFPTKDTYEFEIWTYKNGELTLLLHEYSVSAYNYFDSSFFQYYQNFITVYENEKGSPVIQIYNEVDEICEYKNIYYSDETIIRDKLIYKDSTFYMNNSEITESIWSENIFGYTKILLSSFLSDSSRTSTSLSDGYDIDYNHTLVQTERVIGYLSQEENTPQLSNFAVAEEKYISLYLKKVFESNWLYCEYEETEKYFKEHYYNLYDIDQNGVPELILYEGSSGAGMHYHFYTIIDGEIIHCGDYGRTSLHVNDEGGLIAYFGRMGGYHIDKITLEGSSIETTFIAGDYIGIEKTYPELDELGNENYKYLTFCPPAIPLALYTYKKDISLY